MSKKVKCPRCNGKGTIKQGSGIPFSDGKEITCPNCNGTGYVYEK